MNKQTYLRNYETIRKVRKLSVPKANDISYFRMDLGIRAQDLEFNYIMPRQKSALIVFMNWLMYNNRMNNLITLNREAKILERIFAVKDF